MKLIWRAAALAAGLLTALGLALPASAGATTTPPPLPVSLYGAKGGTAAWNSSGGIVLSNGASGASYVDVKYVSGTKVPQTAPGYTTTFQGAGNPRWVIEFHNGDTLFGYGQPGASTVSTWACGSVTGDYAEALAACQPGYDDQVTAAFIVLDSGNPNQTVTLTNVQYGGAVAVPPSVAKPNVITARYICGPWYKTHWSVFNAAGGRTVGVSVRVFIQRTGKWAWVTHLYRGPGQFGPVWTTHGNQLNVSYLDGYGHWKNFTATVPARKACS